MLTWLLFKNFVFSSRSGALVRTISWICMSGIGVGVFSLVVVMSVMNGFNASIQERFLAVEPHLVVYFSSEKREGRNPRSSQKKWRSYQPKVLAADPQLKSHFFEKQDVVIRTLDGFFTGGVAHGVEESVLNDTLEQMARLNSYGQNFHREPLQLRPSEVLVGIDLARQHGIFEGDELTLAPPESLLLPPGEVPRYEKVTVKDFIRSGIPEVDGGMIFYVRGETLRSLRQTASFRTGVELRMADPMKFAPLQKELSDQGFQVESWRDRNSALFAALQIERLSIGLILGMSALIASFSVLTVLILLTTQKRKEIGLLMSLGLSRKNTYWVFTRLGLLLSGLGMGGGLILGTLVSLYIQENPLDVLPDYYQDTRIPAEVNFQFIALVALAVMVIAIFATGLPARQVARLNPVEALRPNLKR